MLVSPASSLAARFHPCVHCAPLLQVHRDASLAALKAEADDQAAVIQVPWPLPLSNLMPPYLASRSLASCRVIVCTPAPAR